jgi:hypothetical protein
LKNSTTAAFATAAELPMTAKRIAQEYTIARELKEKSEIWSNGLVPTRYE